MSVPGVGSDAATKINEEQITDQEAEIAATEEADELEKAANDYKEDEPHHEDDGEPSQQEGKELEQGAFHSHAFPHLNWQDTEAPDENGAGTEKSGDSGKLKETPSDSVTNGNGKVDRKLHNVRYFGRGGAGGGGAARRQSVTSEQITSEMAELARAEAASWAQMTPLLAATFGPLSVLLGIPTLTQRWHGVVLVPAILPGGRSNFIALPDPTLNLVLAGLTLFCEVMGNFLLILRFSNFHTRVTTWVSYAFWIMKIVFGLANYIEFGIVHPETNEIIYLQGFWVRMQ
jgi:hypothetical protein